MNKKELDDLNVNMFLHYGCGIFMGLSIAFLLFGDHSVTIIRVGFAFLAVSGVGGLLSLRWFNKITKSTSKEAEEKPE